MIAFFDWNVGGQIYLVPANENAERVGEKIAIDYPKETGGLYRLTGWTPDNKIGAIFSSPAEGGLYVFTFKTAKAVQVTRGGLQPHWSPDGRRIIYSAVARQEKDGTGWSAYATAWVPAEGGQATTIPIQADTEIVKAGWGAGNNVSPDGKTIVFAGRKAGEGKGAMHIWTLPIEGGAPTQLTNASAPLADQYPCWSPDGKSIAFVRSRDSQDISKRFMEADIFIIPAGGGEPRQLTSESDMVAFGSIAWSPDRKLLAYLSIDNEWSGKWDTIRVIPAEGGQSRALSRPQRGFEVNVELAWSPDSRRLAFNDYPGTDGGGIKIVSLDDGQVVDVDPGVPTTRLYHLDWSRDGEKLVFAGQQGGVPEFWLIENFPPAGTGTKESK